jgi:hypothetical protein
MADDVSAKLEELHAEIRALRQEQAVTRHLYGVIYWLINFPAICYLFFGQPGLWTKLGIFITLIYSIYANFATDYGAMSAAMAAFGDKPPPEIPLEPGHDG